MDLQKMANAARMLSVEMIERAKSGAAILRRLPNGAQVCYNARVWKRY